jgi:hypothetical protein
LYLHSKQIPEMSVITASKFDAKKLTVSEPKKLDNGSSQVYINYSGGKLRVQAPVMSVPYDAGDYQGNEKFKAQFSFKGRDSNPKIAGYYNMLDAIDNFVIDAATRNAGKWFKMPGATREMIALFYSPSIRYSKDKEGNVKTEYPPTQSVALKKRNGAFDAEMYDDKNVRIEGLTPVECLRRNAEVLPICDATGIWIADKKFGLTWKLHQAQIKVPGDGSAAGGFLAVEEDDGLVTAGAGAGVSAADEADLMAAVMPAARAEPAAAADDDDDEEDDESDHEIAAPPVPTPKKVAVAAPAPAPAPAAKVVKKVVKTTGAK